MKRDSTWFQCSLSPNLFCRSFGLPKSMASSEGDNGENQLADGIPTSLGDAGESCHSRDEHIQGDSHS